jgi:hypothetical protein
MSDLESKDVYDPAQAFGGVRFAYGLKTEYARKALNKVPMVQVKLVVDEISNGHGFLCMQSRLPDDGNRVVTVWLFPNQNPRYLTLLDLLDFCKGQTLLAMCWLRESGPEHVLLFDLIKPL